MMFINIPDKSLLEQLTNILSQKYGLRFKRKFVGFRIETWRSPVTVVNQSNVSYVAYRIAKKETDVCEIFANNSAIWERIEDKEG